jgi:DNA replication protein DnaC
VSSNKSFSAWEEMLKSTVAAMLDHLVHQHVPIVLEGDSYRLQR